MDRIIPQKDGPSRSFFLDTSKGLEISLLLLEGELHTCQFHPQKQYKKKLETGLEKGPIEKERRRMLLLPDGYAYERKDLIDRRFFSLMWFEAKVRLQY